MGFLSDLHEQEIEKLRAQERLALSEAQRDIAAAKRASVDEPVRLAEIAAELDKARLTSEEADAARVFYLRLAMLVGVVVVLSVMFARMPITG